jgi:hypothetical protein
MNATRPLILLSSCLSSVVLAQTHKAPQPPLGLSHVVLQVEEYGTRINSPGHLYKILSPDGHRTLIAQIDREGKLTPAVKCTEQDRIMAEPNNVYATITDEGPKSCKEPATFLYRMPIIKSADSDSLRVAGKLAESGNYSNAQEIYSSVALRATKLGDYDTAALANTASVALTAKIFDDKGWDKYVTRDPKQNYKLILSPEGVGKVKEFQAENKIAPTGVLDVQTQNALTKHKGAIRSGIDATPSFSIDLKQ